MHYHFYLFLFLSGYCSYDLFFNSFVENGIDEEYGFRDSALKIAFDTVGIDHSAPINFVTAFNLLSDPYLNVDWIQNLPVELTSRESRNLSRYVTFFSHIKIFFDCF